MTFEKKQETLKELSKVLRHSIFPVAVDINNLKDHVIYQGLTKREYFAAMAMQGMVANGSSIDIDKDYPYQTRAKTCILIADALIKALNEIQP